MGGGQKGCDMSMVIFLLFDTKRIKIKCLEVFQDSFINVTEGCSFFFFEALNKRVFFKWLLQKFVWKARMQTLVLVMLVQVSCVSMYCGALPVFEVFRNN